LDPDLKLRSDDYGATGEDYDRQWQKNENAQNKVINATFNVHTIPFNHPP
jgi:hypothetical protein